MKLISIIILTIIVAVIVLSIKLERVSINALEARDSDGSDSADILNNMKNGYELVSLKTNPYGYIEVSNFQFKGIAKKVYAIIEWKAYKDLGADNIYVGYSFDDKYIEKGPFHEGYKRETIEIPINMLSDFNKLKIRLRGEDTDFGPDALAEVNIKLEADIYKLSFLK